MASDLELVVGSGDGQFGVVGTQLPTLLRAVVRSASTGQPRRDVTVLWDVTAGGATLIGRRLQDDRLLWSMAGAAVLNGAAVFAAAALANFPLAVALFVVGGLANGVETVAMRSLIVHRVADRFRGRAFASYGALVNGMQIGATAAAGAIVAGLGGRVALLIGGAGTAMAGLAGLVASRSLDRREARIRAAAEQPPTPAVQVPEPPVQLPEPPERPRVTRIPESEPVERVIEP